MEQPDFKHIAAQLRNPSGPDGLETAERMHINNGNMIRSCIDRLPWTAGAKVLETGPGSGLHLPYLFGKEEKLHYTGADISGTMVALATENNREQVSAGKAVFRELAMDKGFAALPFGDNCFDLIFTVNTLYFWDDAPAQAAELFRVLKPGGSFALCYADDTFMRKLPFTQYGFHLYSNEQALQLMTDAGFTRTGLYSETETVRVSATETMEREFAVITVVK